MCCTMNACTHRMSCWAHAEWNFTWLPRYKEERTNSGTVCCSQTALRYFDANSELGYCDTICEGSCAVCPCYTLWCLKSAAHGGQGLNWLGKTVCLKNNAFVVRWGTLQADHSSGPLEGFRNVCTGTQAAEEVGETGWLLTHTATLTYLDCSPNKNPNCILGTNENLGLGFHASPFLPRLVPSFANRWRVPLKWMHRFPCFDELRERQDTPVLSGSETFFVQVSWAELLGNFTERWSSFSHMQWGGQGEEGERMKWGWASTTLDSLPA